MWNCDKRPNIHVTKEKEGAKNVFEKIMAKDFPDLVKDIPTYWTENWGKPKEIHTKAYHKTETKAYL